MWPLNISSGRGGGGQYLLLSDHSEAIQRACVPVLDLAMFKNLEHRFPPICSEPQTRLQVI